MKKEDWQQAFGQPSASFDARFRQTLDRIDQKEEKKMKHMSFRAIVIVVALLLALTGVAYAATQGWMIGDYFGKRGPGQTPEGFESGFAGDYTQEIGEVRFRIRDAYVSGDVLTALVEVERKDGKPALFVPEGIEEDDLIACLDQSLSFEPTDRRTIAEYARDEGMAVYLAGSWFTQDGRMLEGAGDEWAEDGYNMLVMMCQVHGIHSENDTVKLSWDIYLTDQQNGYQPQSLEIELPVEPYQEWTVEVNKEVEGLPVVVDRLMLRQSRMELDVDITYHLNIDKMPAIVEENSPAAWDYIYMHLCDPDTDEKLPMGARIVGGMQWLNAEHTAFEGALSSISGEYEKDTIRLKFYDPWQDAYIGAIDVKIK